jgi:hypothetical protein
VRKITLQVGGLARQHGRAVQQATRCQHGVQC